MSYQAIFQDLGPAADDWSRRSGWVLLEFGTQWCSHCQAAQAAIEEALAAHPALPHCKIEDGPGRPLGRRLRVKLWPTLVLLHDGQEVGRLVRPTAAFAVRELLACTISRPSPQNQTNSADS